LTTIHIAKTAAEARAHSRRLARPLGFVPTMGALHEGHRSLIRRAKDECASVAVSIFVNPLQFAPDEDFTRYPRTFERDLAMLEHEDVDLVYAPDAAVMYPHNFATALDVGPLAHVFEGAARPGHFRGVATIVTKLLHAVEPDIAYFGQKDAQQIAVIRRLMTDLDFAPALTICPTVREHDGLALSSRNEFLSVSGRAAAPSLYRALVTIATAIESGIVVPGEAIERGRGELAEPLEEEYLAVVDPNTFDELDPIRRPALVIGAVRAGTTRLLDNVPLPPEKPVAMARELIASRAARQSRPHRASA
jgi:pantoate--beta-alanine ligase